MAPQRRPAATIVEKDFDESVETLAEVGRFIQ
jgi:hypothetical protein